MTSAGRPRIVYVVSRLPTQVQSGADLRVRGQMMALLELGELAVFGVSGRGASIDPRVAIWRSATVPPVYATSAREIALAIARGESPFQSHFSDGVAAELTASIHEFQPDVTVLSRLEVAPYLPVVRAASGCRVVVDLDEAAAEVTRTIAAIDTDRGSAMLTRRLAISVAEVEAAVLRAADAVWASSDDERSLFAAEHDTLPPIWIVPNTVDTDSFGPPDAGRDPWSMIFPGGMHYVPNVDAVRFLAGEVLPLLPEATLRIVGTLIPDWMGALGDRVHVVGAVPDIRPHLAAAGMMPIPIRAGGGTRLKALEAMAAGVPVVASAFGVKGLDLQPGLHYLPAETAADYAAACRRVVDHPAAVVTMTTAARALVERRYSHHALVAAIAPSLQV